MWLEYLADQRVLDVQLIDGGSSVRIEEACDNYFRVDLYKKAFAALIQELQDLHDQMP